MDILLGLPVVEAPVLLQVAAKVAQVHPQSMLLQLHRAVPYPLQCWAEAALPALQVSVSAATAPAPAALVTVAVQNPTAYLQVPSHILLLHQVALAAQVIHLAIHVLLLPDPYLWVLIPARAAAALHHVHLHRPPFLLAVVLPLAQCLLHPQAAVHL